MRVASAVAAGSGAHVIHSLLQEHIPAYTLYSYNAYRSLFPPLIYPLCRSSKADLIHTVADYGIFSHDKNVPLVSTFHSYFFDKEMRAYSSPLQNIHYATDLKWFVQLLLAKAKKVTAVSHFIADKVSGEMNYEADIRVIHNGVDTDKFFPLKKNENKKHIKVLFVGNLTRRKGADLLPAIAAGLKPGVHIQYTAGFRRKTLFEDRDNLTNLGRINYGAMPSLYQSADILLFPTVREGFGLAAAEAMASGLPVVSSDCSSLPELVDEGKGGFLCPVGNVKLLAEKINILAESSKLRREMGEYNRDKIERCFTLKKMIRAYQNLFEESLS